MNNTLYIDSSGEKLIVSGAISLIFDSKRALRYMKDWLSFERVDDVLEIEISGEMYKYIDRIKNVASMASCEMTYSNSVNDEVHKYILEDEKFEEFSQKALNIRNNNCDLVDLNEYKESLIANMAKRGLYPLQLLSSYHLAFSQNGCNFSVPGAGKTSVVYGAFAYLKNLADDHKKNVQKIIIIAPLSAFGPWEMEYEECFGRKPNIKRILGNMSIEAKRQYFYDNNPAEVTLISYASFVGVVDEVKYFLNKFKTMVVLDEAHKIKNTSGGITATAIMDIAALCNSRVVLTGTPAPNGYEDLMNLFKFIWPTKSVIKYNAGQLKDMSKSKSDPRVGTLLNSIAPYFIRIKKNDLNLPPANSNPPILVEMNPKQRKIYDLIERKYISDITDNTDQKFKNELVRARLIRLMQAAANPELLKRPLSEFLGEENITLNGFKEDSFIKDILEYNSIEVPAKYEKAKDIINELLNVGEKVIVWASYIKSIEMFSKYLASFNIESRILYGATPIAADGMTKEDEEYELTREAIIEEFHKPECQYKVIIANPHAISESISLHKACHNAIYIERSFNAAHFMQSKDRIHRYGLKPDVITNYYYILSKDSIDEVIHERLTIKENRMIEIIESMPIPLFDNTLLEGGDDDVKAVLKDYARRFKTQ